MSNETLFVRVSHLTRWPILTRLVAMHEAWTEIKPQAPTDRHPHIGIAMCVDREPFDGGRRRLPHDPLDRRSRLPLVSHQGLIVHDPPLIEDVRVDADPVGSPPGVDPSVPEMP